MSKIETIKEITLKNHGNYLYGSLDGLDFTPSGIISETKQSYGASVKLKFIVKQTYFKKHNNGESIEMQRVLTQIVKINTTDEELPMLVKKYNLLVGKSLLINYSLRDGETVTVQDENEITEIK